MKSGRMQSYQSPGTARTYRMKYETSMSRRFSNRLEMRALRRTLRHAGVRGRVLDTPCGAGRLIPELLGHDIELVAADYSPAMVAEARDATRHLPRAASLRLMHANALALPFADRSFDWVVCWRLIHHFPDPADRARLFAELARVTRRGVIMTYSDGNTLKGWLRAVRGRVHATHSVLTRDQFASEAARAGLTVSGRFHLNGAFSLVTSVALVRS